MLGGDTSVNDNSIKIGSISNRSTNPTTVKKSTPELAPIEEVTGHVVSCLQQDILNQQKDKSGGGLEKKYLLHPIIQKKYETLGSAAVRQCSSKEESHMAIAIGGGSTTSEKTVDMMSSSVPVKSELKSTTTSVWGVMGDDLAVSAAATCKRSDTVQHTTSTPDCDNKGKTEPAADSTESQEREGTVGPNVPAEQKPQQLSIGPIVPADQKPQQLSIDPNVPSEQKPQQLSIDPNAPAEQKPQQLSIDPNAPAEQKPQQLSIDPNVPAEQKPQQLSIDNTTEDLSELIPISQLMLQKKLKGKTAGGGAPKPKVEPGELWVKDDLGLSVSLINRLLELVSAQMTSAIETLRDKWCGCGTALKSRHPQYAPAIDWESVSNEINDKAWSPKLCQAIWKYLAYADLTVADLLVNPSLTMKQLELEEDSDQDDFFVDSLRLNVRNYTSSTARIFFL